MEPLRQLEIGSHVLVDGLRNLGYIVDDSVPAAFGTPAPNGNGFVRFEYRIKLGSRRGEVVPIGYVAPTDFPINPPAGIYVYGELRPLSSDNQLPHGGVSDASGILGPGWRYWSRTHDSWARSTRDARAWMKLVDRLFLDL